MHFSDFFVEDDWCVIPDSCSGGVKKPSNQNDSGKFFADVIEDWFDLDRDDSNKLSDSYSLIQKSIETIDKNANEEFEEDDDDEELSNWIKLDTDFNVEIIRRRRYEEEELDESFQGLNDSYTYNTPEDQIEENDQVELPDLDESLDNDHLMSYSNHSQVSIDSSCKLYTNNFKLHFLEDLKEE